MVYGICCSSFVPLSNVFLVSGKMVQMLVEVHNLWAEIVRITPQDCGQPILQLQ